MEEDSNRSGGAVYVNASSVFSDGGRLRFSVELNPDETNIVSWKKLVDGAAKSQEALDSSFQVQSNAHPALEARMAPPNKGEKTDVPPANHRFSAVIEKIERLYMGQHSSDEEDMNDVPDDDEYDTEDSFIDDEELDEYFQVDNSAIKHDGFFVNRGKLERIEPPLLPRREPPSLPSQSPKKRKRKDLTKSQTEAEKCDLPTKPPKVRKKVAGKSHDLVATDISHGQSSVSCKEVNIKNKIHASQSSLKEKFAATTTSLLDKYVPSKVFNCDVGVSVPEEKDVFKKMGNGTHRHPKNKLKDRKLTTNVNELDQSSRKKGKDGFCEPANICVSEIKHPMQTVNGPFTQKEASGIKPKISMLDKAIKDLEKMVQESAKLSPVEVRDADNVSQAVKRRLPCEVKQKLAKVAKLAQISHGKISKELLDRLMSILGHLVQLRTLKRNLNIMVNSGLSAKKEREERLHQMKKEVADIIELQIPYMKKPMALEHQADSSDDFQETGNPETEVMQKQYSMNEVLEDKICDIYELFIEGRELDEDVGTQARKLYTELARLWPEGFMDNHGIKRAMCRAKSRQNARHSEQKEKIKKRKLVRKSAVEEEEGVKAVVQSQNGKRKLALAQLSRPANTSSQMVITSPSLDKSKLDKSKRDSVNVSDVTRITDPTVKKKVKRKQPLLLEEAQYSHKKTSSSSSFINGEEIHKPRKQHLVDALQKPTFKPPSPIAATPLQKKPTIKPPPPIAVTALQKPTIKPPTSIAATARTIYELPPNLSNA